MSRSRSPYSEDRDYRDRDRGGSRGRPQSRVDVRGHVIRINDRSGYGFLEVEGETDEVFFHSNDVTDSVDIRQLREGDEVRLDLHPSKKKPGRYDAKNVQPPESAKDRAETGRRPSPRRRSYSRSPRRGRRGRSYSRSPSYSRRRRGRSRSRDRGYDRDRRRGDGRKNILCLDFKRGDCRYGDRCKFSHNRSSRRY